MSTVTKHPESPVVLIVLDGWGESTERDGNAILQARTPIYRELRERYPSSLLTTCGEAVGLPAGQMGNSEVGHMNLGAGRVVFQDLTRIDQAIAAGDDQFVHLRYVLQTSGARRPGPLGVELHGNGVDTTVGNVGVEQCIDLLLTLDRRQCRQRVADQVELKVAALAFYRHLGIDTGATFLDNSGRPRYVLERRELIKELT